MMTRICFRTKLNRSIIGFVILTIIATLFSGCAPPNVNKEAVERAVIGFHYQLDSEEYSALYEHADADLKKATSQDDFEKLLRAVHKKLGHVLSANPAGSVVTAGTNGTYVQSTYETTFVEGKGIEQFVWRMRDDRLSLYGYTINSNELITK